MEPKYLEILAQTVLFQEIDIKDIPHILDCLGYKIVHYRKNDFIVRVNSPFRGVYFVLEGETAIIRETCNGDRVILNVFRAGDICGEALAFSGPESWPSSFQAISDSTVMVLHLEKLMNVCKRPCVYHSTILMNTVHVVAKKAYELNKKVEYLSLKTIKGKLSKYLLEQKDRNGSLTFTLPLNREKLADYLNVSRPSMSRELASMRDSGIIDYHRAAIRIIDEAKLMVLVEEC
jgi:CRP-like cAMP-binding protein